MFVIQDVYTFKWPVQFSVPADGGKYDTHTVTLEFRMLGQDEMTKEMNAEGATDAAFAASVIVGWDGVSIDGKSNANFNTENLRRFLNIPMVAARVSTAYVEAIKGGLARKN